MFTPWHIYFCDISKDAHFNYLPAHISLARICLTVLCTALKNRQKWGVFKVSPLGGGGGYNAGMFPNCSPEPGVCEYGLIFYPEVWVFVQFAFEIVKSYFSPIMTRFGSPVGATFTYLNFCELSCCFPVSRGPHRPNLASLGATARPPPRPKGW